MTPTNLPLRGALLILLAGCSGAREEQSAAAQGEGATKSAAAADYRASPDLAELDV
jgi:hypothetical protein